MTILYVSFLIELIFKRGASQKFLCWFLWRHTCHRVLLRLSPNEDSKL